MNNELLLHWYEHPKKLGNFGDELNHYLINKITNKTISNFPKKYIEKSNFYVFKKLLGRLRYNDLKLKEIKNSVEYKIIFNPLYIVIGSIISWYDRPNVIVWGAGIMSKTENVKKANFLAVRGYYTAERLKELGFKAPSVFGDPALLLPLFYKPKEIKKIDNLIIPHVTQFEEALKIFNNRKDVEVLDLCDSIETIIDKINCANNIYSSSLHGIIVAHAYNKKALWTNFSHLKINGDNIKFKDYFSSLRIEEYDYFEVKKNEDFDYLVQKSFIDLYNPQSKIIEQVQKDLLKVCPFL